MMLYTGLTVAVHVTIVAVGKSYDFTRRTIIHVKNHPERGRIMISTAVIAAVSLATIMMSFQILQTALMDDHATWRIVYSIFKNGEN